MGSSDLSPTERTTVRRLPERGRRDRTHLESILDEGFVCHVGFIHDGSPVVIPTAYCRVDQTLYLHGSPASRMLRGLKKGVDVCVTVTLVDGIVVARSAFHHSMNYRSAVIFGRAFEVVDVTEKRAVLDGFVDHVLPGRAAESRPGNEKELRATTVLAVPLTEASVKIREGGPIDDDEDYALDHWAGVLPLGTAIGVPEPDAGVDGLPPPSLDGFADKRG
ncbi:MAG: pyridoxamine 5'-phosphate oxidase family protein [Acidimicrobiia bacterium]|nr:pyridoxamine 5'-phosphate oxidase family protein [Acidimicrobiia bacterium]